MTIPQFTLFVKQACPTCALIEPVVQQLQQQYPGRVQVFVQDDPAFPNAAEQRIDDTSLASSFQNQIEVVPTLIKHNEAGAELSRTYGWDQQAWIELTEIANLGSDLPAFKPGCGSMTLDPGMEEQLLLRFGKANLSARELATADAEDEMEACYERGWTDGLPVVPPTPLRVLKMLRASRLDAQHVVGHIPPDNNPCTVEKVAINAVMAGCKPDYFTAVLASVRAALQVKFCMHGLLCTTYFSAPVMIVSGPVCRAIGMNSGINALGQGNRANATIGRALQLLIRNIGGGVPGGIDRATMGNPGKYTYCFAEDETDSDWPTLAMDRGYSREESVISLFAGEGLQPIMDQLSRTPESLAKSMASSLRSVAHVKRFGMADAILLVCPEHRKLLREAGWDKAQLKQAIFEELMTPGAKLLEGVDGMAEGMPERLKDKQLNKFRDDGLHIVTTGGTAGKFSAIISGWVASGERGSQLVSDLIQ